MPENHRPSYTRPSVKAQQQATRNSLLRKTTPTKRRPSSHKRHKRADSFDYRDSFVFTANQPARTGKQTSTTPHQRVPILIIAIAALLIIVIVFVLAQSVLNRQENASATSDIQASQVQDTQQADQAGPSTTITITALGDCTLGTDPKFNKATNFITKYNNTNASYFFKNVLPYTESDDLTIANFEGTLTESTDIQEKTFNFKAPASYAKILTEGNVEAANLANNHSYDYGQQGFDDTQTNLEEQNIINFGYAKTATTEIKGVKVGLFGISQLRGVDTASEQTQTDIQTLKDDGCNLIIGVFHWGIERDDLPTSDQVALAHEAIDTGCDLVIGGHPHVLQGVERYKDRYICYSMGNFCFGGNSNPSDKDTMMYQQTFTFKNGQLVTNDETNSQVSIIPCSISSSSGTNNYQPTPLDGSEGARVVKKVNTRSKGLSGVSVDFSSALDDNGRAAVVR